MYIHEKLHIGVGDGLEEGAQRAGGEGIALLRGDISAAVVLEYQWMTILRLRVDSSHS